MPVFLSFLSGVTLFHISNLFPASALIVFLLMTLSLVLRKKYIFLPIIIIGAFYAYYRFIPAIDPSAIDNSSIVINCIAKSSANELASGRFSNEVTVLLAHPADEHSKYLENRDVSVISDSGLQNGFEYKIVARPARDNERHNPGTFRNQKFYIYLTDIITTQEAASKNSFHIFSWFQDRRNRLNHYLNTKFSGDSGALIAAMTTGERKTMSERIKNAFTVTGLAHLLSISGTHFGLFSALIFWLLRFILTSLPYRYLQRFSIFLTPSQAAAIASLPFMFAYLIISGSSIPALRSFIMINVFLFGLLLGRKGFWLNSIVFAAFIICLWEPSAIADISFQLSFLAVLFIGISVGDRNPDKNSNRPAKSFIHTLKNALLLSVAVSLGTTPLIAYYFHYVSIISPLANLLITPFIGFVLVPLALASTFIFIFTGYYPFQALISQVSVFSLKGVQFFASIPFSELRIPAFPSAVIIFCYSGFFIYLINLRSGRHIKKQYLCIFPVIAIVLFSVSLVSYGNNLAVTCLDVGQGDSAIIEAAGKVIVIDTGRTGKEPAEYLRYLGRKSIDALVITHADGDHSGGALYLSDTVKIKELWDTGLLIYPDGPIKNIIKRSLERGDEIRADGFRIQVLHPYKGFYTFENNEAFSENNNSLVFKVSGREKSFLFTSDVAEEAEENMLHLGRWLKSDVLKVSHHGSRTSTTEEFLKAVAPDIAIISVGKYNTYGHPDRHTMERLRGIKIYRTDLDGAIKIVEESGRLNVKTYRDFQLEPARSLAAEGRNIRRLFMKW